MGRSPIIPSTYWAKGVVILSWRSKRIDKRSMVRREREDEGKKQQKHPRLNTGESTRSHAHQVIQPSTLIHYLGTPSTLIHYFGQPSTLNQSQGKPLALTP